jgi:hypothetical protein
MTSTSRAQSAFLALAALGLAISANAQQPPQAPLPQDEYIQRPTTVPHGLAPGMKVVQIGKSPRVFQVNLTKGDEVVSGMTDFAEKYHLKTSQVTAVGAFSSATLAWTDPVKRAFKKIPIDSEVEVVFNGSITVRDGKPNFHAHVICVFPDGSTKGGHLIEAHVGIIAEIFVTEPDMGSDAKDTKSE